MASTTRGFAFASSEGPRRLVDSGLQRISAATKSAVKALDRVLRKTMPLFVAFQFDGITTKRRRGRHFADAVAKSCDALGIMVLPVAKTAVRALSEKSAPTKWDVAEAVAKRFPEIAAKLPSRRKPWQSEDDRIGIFMALAAAVVAWEEFRKPRP